MAQVRVSVLPLCACLSLQMDMLEVQQKYAVARGAIQGMQVS